MSNSHFNPILDPILEKPLPSSPDTERAILGAITLDNALVAQAIELLKPSDFYVPSHRRIFVAMIALFERGSEINPILVAEELRRDNSLDSSGGVLFLTNLTNGLPHVTSIEPFCKIIRGKSLLRQLVRAAQKITTDALEEREEPSKIVEQSEQAIFEVANDSIKKSFSPAYVIADERLNRLEQIQSRQISITGVSSGLADLDRLTLGFQKQDLILVAARPSVGKSSLALASCLNASLRLGLRVAMFSLEMSLGSLLDRILCAEASIDGQRFRAGYVSEEEWVRLGQVREQLKASKFFIDDTPAITALQIEAKVMRLVAEHGPLDLMVVDYLQLMNNTKKVGTREQEISQISMDLKILAKKFDVPLLALSQLNRKSEDRIDGRPQLSDLRESGAQEANADVAILMSREDQRKRYQVDYVPTNKAELDVAKQRNGPTGSAYVRFDSTTGRWDNLYTDELPF